MMKKLSAIGIWFCLFIFMLVAVLFWMPDSYRIHPRLEMPDIVFLRSQPPPQASDNNILIIGDSFAALAPWSVAKRFCYGGTSIAQITKKVRHHQVNDSITEALVFAGVASLFCFDEPPLKIKEDMLILKSLLTQKYPNAHISMVSVDDMLQCVKEYPRGNDKLHPSPLGYEILRQRHFPHLTF